MASLISEFAKTSGQKIKCEAAVALKANEPMQVTPIYVDPPKAGEVRIKVVSNALCHTDVYTLEGHDPEGLFPSVLGHEATGIVESLGKGVTSLQVGDVVIPCYTPECRSFDCIFCASPKTNLCPKIRATQGKGLMPDGTSRLSTLDGKQIFHFMGCSTFAEYAVISEISAAKIHPGANLREMCLLGCGVSTGWGAVINAMKMEPCKSVAVLGLGALGLAVIQASKVVGASDIVGIDINEKKFNLAKEMGATRCVVSGEDIKDQLLTAKHKWGYDYTFDCTGNVNLRQEKEISARPFQLITGRQWKGSAFGGWKSRSEVPKLVQSVMRGEYPLKPYITHTFDGLKNVNGAIEALHGGSCLRAVVNIHLGDLPTPIQLPTLEGNVKLEGGTLQQIKHWSSTLNCAMKFSIFLPKPAIDRTSKSLPPVLYYLSGLTCTDENARTKASYASIAAQHGLAVVFPDTSPRGINIEGQDDSWDFGSGAGFYLNATESKWSEHYRITSITGHSMGGHGALICHFKNPGKYVSVSAFSPICNPTKCPWGVKAFKGYLGSVDNGKVYDATELIKTYSGPKAPILIDVGTKDGFLESQLMPKNLINAAGSVGYPIQLRYQPGYDHSYYFISSFMKDHVEHHARALNSIHE
ncbi:frmA [Lepeophtheirus salmonis]|uniref:FrmA n=1 Tax=Lepeophtheirus salmonis TaxID=72036 RepID=A0A7R8CMX9_LEPSM|nr:frmA [Lepeophtheirus salmonis]CAF2870383.1 frmA [Lepeophtheirus salmonis]